MQILVKIGSGVSEGADVEFPTFSLTCVVVLKTLDSATSHSYGASQNSTFRNFVLHGPIFTKLGTVDYVGDP